MLFEAKGLHEIATEPVMSEFTFWLEEYGAITSAGEFDRRFGEAYSCKITVYPFESVAYRLTFAATSNGALALGWLVTGRQARREVAEQDG